MRKVVVLLLIAGLCLVTGAFAADPEKDKAIKETVDGIVGEIDGGKKAEEYKADDYDPYVFIMQEDGMLVVHPKLQGESLKEKAGPVYEELIKATPEGVWVDYEWQGAQKHSYVRKTGGGLIVGSGY
jgi:hypothetical protein